MQFSCNKHACGPHRNPSAHIVRSNLLIPTYNITRAYIVCVCVCIYIHIVCVCVLEIIDFCGACLGERETNIF